MYNIYNPYLCHHYINTPMYNLHNMHNIYKMHPYPYCVNYKMYNPNFSKQFTKLKDYGPEPFVIDIEKATKQNNTYRTALWTGDNLQVTLMSIDPGDEIGLEVHPKGDQFIRIEEGQGLVQMGDKKDKLDYQKKVYDDFAIMIPAGKWHNVINTGNKPLKLYAIYAPPEHPYGTVHETKAIAQAAEENYGN
ncbi:cupin domain-containing protein [Tepidibacter hydrothermalis]|uniref:Cupin domain-containing protein n=1 Tax=Tepidibacter hydrothermalis TaxID=3036126 RepID=A0ABY8EFY3_9FIRM|nr:cupin domain-containing protein [Tepidibacter hydrothermalis]WFD11838.1 cupin domain-containing protein [Tepidibacter hydrothermalis]